MTDTAYHSILQLVSIRQSLTTGSTANGYLGFTTIDDSNATGVTDAGRIAIVNETGNTVYSPTALSFWTSAGVTDIAATEKVRITSSGNVGIGTTAPVGILEVGDISTGPGGMLIKRISVNDYTATTFWTTPGVGEWAGIVEITAVATNDVNRSAYKLSRFAYNETFTTLVENGQNCVITLTMSGTNMQIELSGAGATVYRVVIRIMGSEES